MFNNIWLSVGSRILLNLFSMSHIPVYDIKLDWKYVHTICFASSTHWCELWIPFCRRHFHFMRILQFYSNFVAAGTQRSIRQQQFCVLLGINLNYLIHFNVILSISTDSIGLNTQQSPGIVVCRYTTNDCNCFKFRIRCDAIRFIKHSYLWFHKWNDLHTYELYWMRYIDSGVKVNFLNSLT